MIRARNSDNSCIISGLKQFYELLRVVRFKLTDETYECIITNLPQEEYPPDVLKELYRTRNLVETDTI